MARTRTTARQLESTLSYLCQKASKRVRDAGLHARTVTLTLRYADFKTISRSHTLAEPSDLDAVFLKAVARAFPAGLGWDREIAAGGSGAFSLFGGASGQLDLLDPGRREKLERLARATDRLRDKFGFSKVQFGGSLGTRERREE